MRVRDQIARMRVRCVSFAYRSGALKSRILFACETVVDSIVSSNDPFKCRGLAITRCIYCNQRTNLKSLIVTIIVFYL